MTSTPVRVGGFLVALVAVFGAAWGVGKAIGPTPQAVGPTAEPAAAHLRVHQSASPTGRQAAPAAPVDIPGGLMVSQSGYTFDLARGRARAGDDVPVAFTVEGPDGRPVTDYAVEHETRLHLIAVRRDFTGFQHVHPRLGAGGEWTTRLDLTPGPWRLFADFQAAGGPSLTLGSDLAVAGVYDPVPDGGESSTARVDGYTVALAGALTAGEDAMLRLTVSRNGDPVTDLQPYLGAYGHLVALREGDLAYLHVHPHGHPGDGTTRPGPDVVFHATVPSAGRYRLYLDFKHQAVVRTAAFTTATRGER
ncbi:MAG: hypothetical protein M3211_08820 [Actinomycetota bacterium]|nr:hypothetical protein [Actinomycetota bacterium]